MIATIDPVFAFIWGIYFGLLVAAVVALILLYILHD